MTPQALIVIAQLALAFGKEAAMTYAQIHDRLVNGQPVTREEILQWLQALDYATHVPNSFLNNPPKIAT
jgi:hypothetical protein